MGRLLFFHILGPHVCQSAVGGAHGEQKKKKSAVRRKQFNHGTPRRIAVIMENTSKKRCEIRLSPHRAHAIASKIVFVYILSDTCTSVYFPGSFR